MIALEYRIKIDSICAMKHQFRRVPEGKLTDFSSADLNHGVDLNHSGNAHTPAIKDSIWGMPALEYRFSAVGNYHRMQAQQWKNSRSTMQAEHF